MADDTVETRIPDAATARRCIDALADYLRRKDDSPLAAADLQYSVKVLIAAVRAEQITEIDLLKGCIAELEPLLDVVAQRDAEIERLNAILEQIALLLRPKSG